MLLYWEEFARVYVALLAKVASFYFLFEIKLLTAQVIASASSICASTPSLLIFQQKRGVVGTYHKYDEEDLYLRLAKLIHMLLLHLTSLMYEGYFVYSQDGKIWKKMISPGPHSTGA